MVSYLQIVWVIGLASQITLLLVLVKTQRHRIFPFLTYALLWEVFSALTLRALAPHSTNHVLFIEYWVMNLVDTTLQLALFLQLGRNLWGNDPDWRQKIGRTLRGTTVGGMALIVVVYLSLLPSFNISALLLWDVRLELFTTLISLMFFFAVIFASNYGGFVWTRFPIALTKGLALIQVTHTAADYGHLVRGWVYSEQSSELLKVVVYTGVMVYWTVDCLVPFREDQGAVSENIDIPLRKRA